MWSRHLHARIISLFNSATSNQECDQLCFCVIELYSLALSTIVLLYFGTMWYFHSFILLYFSFFHSIIFFFLSFYYIFLSFILLHFSFFHSIIFFFLSFYYIFLSFILLYFSFFHSIILSYFLYVVFRHYCDKIAWYCDNLILYDIRTTNIDWGKKAANRTRSWSYGSWNYDNLRNHCLSPLTLWVRILFMRGVLDTTLCNIKSVCD